MTALDFSRKSLQRLESVADHSFAIPIKRIHDGHDVDFFLASKAYTDIMTFLFQLNASMIARKRHDANSGIQSIKEWNLQDPDVKLPTAVQNLAKLLEALSVIIEEAPPDPGPRRFGNISFRKWYDIVKERLPDLLAQYLPSQILAPGSTSETTAKAELEAYLVGSFGSAQRLDYGTGHELSFLAFLGALWKVGAFPESHDGDQERALVLGVIEPYLQLIRRLILTYTLEPAGSHGVWGLDDHSFLPYIFGSAQFSPAISTPSEIALEGSLSNAPRPGDVAKANAVQRERQRNMYFGAIGFIYDVKTGPFWEHSPILFDISGVQAGWAKINKGMLKMYHGEVLSKFPVVQHFPFGSLFAWERDPAAAEVAKSVHTSSQPSRSTAVPATARPQQPLRDVAGGAESGVQTTRAPWASAAPGIPPSAGGAAVPNGPNQPTRAPWTSSTPVPPAGGSTTAPWARPGGSATASGAAPVTTTRAPWADRKPTS
ncbi:Phosphotyrosyl phosphate activator protein-domain-containing protein [Dendryphion nanum]|uniref:Serine/threonine-protein phosphatase 2A activator n=1 Tax=Dendryphion nanum TaxID=256645 RepID=A0A9P9DIT6_9PLEO|nr:Phosphotyrosyl phosphate activator protein-domain-containing protein [Dendryphion nanum]